MDTLSPPAQAENHAAQPAFAPGAVLAHLAEIRRPLYVVADPSTGAVGTSFELPAPPYTLIANLPATYPEWLGDRSFLEGHQVRFPYVQGAMANGIATAPMVIAMAKAGMLGFFGAGGLPLDRVERAVSEIQAALGTEPGPGAIWGSNLIHSPHEPALEEQVADLYIRKGVVRASASAYMRLTPAVVRYAYHGIHVDAAGNLVRPHHVFAKISRPEVAEQFMRPAPQKLLQLLVSNGWLTPAQAELAAQVPVAQDVTVESDSGGHTDNRPLVALFPTIQRLRDRCVAEHGFPIRVGAAGGIGTPASVASAFALGAAYVLTGSVNQSTLEAGLSPQGKAMLAEAGVADVVMAPSPDMFELGVKVQVLKRGTLFASRAQQLYELYQTYADWSAVPPALKQKVESTIFKMSFDDVWSQTEQFWEQRTPKEAQKARQNPRHKMALCFRWYVGLSSHWAILGTPERVLDYQVWCGPAMGAFNDWVKGTYLEPLENRSVVQVARNLLEGAAVITRAQQLRTFGVDVPRVAFDFEPVRLEGGPSSLA